MSIPPKLTTVAACRVARIDRDRLNEHVAAGRFRCAPQTVPGRTRLFDPDDMVALWLFRDLMDDGLEAARAGYIACEVAEEARRNPEAPAISFVVNYFVPFNGAAMTADKVPSPDTWDKPEGFVGGVDIRKVMTFNVKKVRELIAHYTEEERSIIGERE